MTPSYPYTHHRNPRLHRRHHHHHNDPRLLAITLLLFTGACLCSNNAHHDVKSSKAGTRSSQQDKSSSDDVNTGNDVNREANTSDDNTNKNAINKTANKINPNRMELSNINDVIKHYDNMFADNNKNNEVSTVKLKTIPKMTNFTNHDISNINNDEATTIDNDYTNHDISNINNDEATTIDNDYTNLTTNKSVCSNSIDNNNNNDNNNDNNSDDNSNKDTNNSVCCNSIDNNNNNNNKDNNNSNNNTNANYKANFKLNTKIPSNHNNNNHSSTAQTIHRYHHTQRQWNEFYDALLTCKSESITIISDQPKIQRSVMKTVGKLGIPFSQALDDNGNDVTFDDLQQLDRFIRKSYQPAQRNSMSMARDTQNFFIIATEKPDLVLRRVESVFLEEPYRELALLPHRTKWFVFFSTERQWEDLVAQQYRSILDNVVAMKITEVRGSMPYYTLDGISTFMWRPNRTREPSPVDLHSKDKNACVLFPNKDGGMNGRRVTVAPKIYMRRFLTETESPVDGKKMYKGILMDVLDFSSNSSNFTYTLEGENPDGVSYNEMNWKIYAEYLNNGTFDIALSPWSTLFHPFFNVSFSFPFSFDHIIGIYRRPDGRNDYKDALVFLCPFSPIGYVFLVACALYMSILYTLTRNSCNLGSHNFCSNFNPCYIACKRKRQSASSDLQESEEKIGRFRFRFRFSSESTLYNALMDRISVWCLFLITALNQGQLPRPRHTSARLVIGVWAIGIVFYYAVFSSLITAQVAIPRDDPPFTTFKEFLKRNDYSGSIMNETVLIFIMRSASKNSQLGLLRQKSQTFQLARKSNEAIDQNLPTYLEDLKPNVVFFHYESEIRACLRLLGNPDNYVVMENDPIFKSDMALVFPKDSEFDGIVSGDIGMMRESGLQKKIHRQHDAFTWNKKKRSPLMRDKYQVIEIRHMFWIGVTCSVCLLVSAVALILEVSVYRRTEITAKLSSLLPSRMA